MLELQFGLLRYGLRVFKRRISAQADEDHCYDSATTPFYQEYNIKPLATNPAAFQQLMNDESREAAALRSNWKAGRTWHSIDVVATAEKTNMERTDLVRQISRWELNGWCEVKVSGVRMRYRVLKHLPELDEDIDELAQKLFQQLHDREEADVARLRSVAKFVRGGSCTLSFLQISVALFRPAL